MPDHLSADRSGPELPPAIMVHGLDDALTALAANAPVTLLSGPGAALYAGCGWWQAVIAEARAAYPDVQCIDILDCADGTGQAMAALRIGVCRLVLSPDAPGRDSVDFIARAQGGFVLSEPPPSNPPRPARPHRVPTPG
jgi:hypothetical protein